MPPGLSNTVCIRERPILFSGPMIQAIHANRKTQTRRTRGLDWINKHPYYKDRVGKIELREGKWHFWDKQAGSSALPIFSVKCPYGKVGDELWIRETWGCPAADHPLVKGGRKPTPGDKIVYRADPADEWQWRGGDGCSDFVWRPSILMPRWACRTKAELTGIRIERLQQLSGDDAKAEGADCATDLAWNGTTDRPDFWSSGHIAGFRRLWDKINGTGSWDRNDHLWVLTFRVLENA